MTDVLIISFAAFFTSGLTAAMGVGGGVVLLALMAQVVPPAILIPLHACAQLLSNTNRVLVQRKHINWAYLRPFFVGSAIGGALLTPLVLYIPPSVGLIALSLFILIATWRPAWLRIQQWKPPIAGGITTGLSLVLGATGPLVMSVLPKENWSRHVVVGSHGMAMTIQHGVKLVAFTALDFPVLDYWQMLVGIAIATAAGNLAGAKLLGKMNENMFKTALNWLLTILSLRLLWQGITSYATV